MTEQEILEQFKRGESFIDDKNERILKELIQGRKPVNDYEREIVKSIEEIEKKGGVVDIPFN